MRSGLRLKPDRDQPRLGARWDGERHLQRWLVLPLRRAYLGFLLLWRKHAPRADETGVRGEQAANRRRALEERRLAAEEYHWAIVGDARRSRAIERLDATTDMDRVAGEGPRRRPGG
jgi:hypothetical protein